MLNKDLLKLTSTLTIFLALFFCGNVKAVNPTTNSHITLQSIQALRIAGQLNKAKADAQQYLKDTPRDGDVILVLASINFQQGNTTEAQILARKVLTQVPTYTDARVLLIKIQIVLKEYDAAQSQLQEGLKFAPNNPDLKKLQQTLVTLKNPPQVAPVAVTTNKPMAISYKTIQTLKNNNQLAKAKQLALEQLKNYPKDWDTMLILGNIYFQENNLNDAKKAAELILQNAPKYTDARLLLIRVFAASKKYEDALQELKVGLKLDPKNQDLLKLQTTVLAQIKLPVPAVLPQLEKIYKIDQACAEELAKRAEYFYSYKQHHVAAAYAKDALALDPQNKKGKEIIANLKSASGKYAAGLNEIGYLRQDDHVSDLDQWWNSSTTYLTHHGEAADLNMLVNFAQRRGIKGTQEEVLWVPFLDKNVRMEVDMAFSNKIALFPRFASRAEGYFNIPKFIEFSVGQYYADIQRTHYSYTTYSLTKEFAKAYINFRSIRYLPEVGEASTLYILNLKGYFKNDNDHFVWVTLGTGKSPDLNDLLTVDFIVIKNDFIYLGYHFPVLNNKVAFNIGGDYQSQVFPTGRKRELMGGIFGIQARF
ncbi:MAG: tetratricopeptide repeat protein [Gammaproteobacteria bacterium]|nr:tetratricopeptide repeat protein [Gammaproteobacteria bacterium]